MGKRSKKGLKKTLLAAAVLAAILLSACILGAPMAHAEENECATKYPVVLVHGAGFRDSLAGINYWGRIPAYLEERGAAVYYGGTDGWSSVAQGAADLKATVEKVLAETGSEKVNIIAHSKGGLDARYMIASLGLADQVASLTTISTPHHGSKVLDTILKVPDEALKAVAVPVNLFCRVIGDKNPDFHRGLLDMSIGYMERFNEENPDQPGVYYQSFAGELYAPASDILLCWPAYWIKVEDGQNDALVAVESAQWANYRGAIRGAGYRGISHADEVDLRRADIEIEPLLGATTVPGLYAALVAELGQMGY